MLKSKKLYSMFPPSYLGLALGSVWGAGFLVSALIEILAVVQNIFIFLFFFSAILLVTNNLKNISFKRMFLVSIVGTICTDIYTFFAIPFLYYNVDAGISPPLSLYIPPNIYNFFTLVVFSGLITFLCTWLLLKKTTIKYVFMIALVTAIATLPWYIVLSLAHTKSANPELEVSKTVSTKQANDLAETISGTGINERLTTDYVLPKYKKLDIDYALTVPQTGKYHISIDFLLQKHKGIIPVERKEYPTDVSVNGGKMVGSTQIDLQKGENTLHFSISYIIKRSDGTEKLNLNYADKNDGTYGPYILQVVLEDVQTPEGIVRLKKSTNEYVTRAYNYTEFYTQ